ncbi:MAG TPA: acylphosphatase [Candidatus Paceibacterota bacterium]|jgi:acylphosphatase|nr:acylphosphatase [Candidatus Paceibacterota bacterium]
MWKYIEVGIAGKDLGSDYPSLVKELALSLGIVGALGFKSDGSIKIAAEGEEANLMDFAGKLEKGNPLTPIENFYVNWHEPEEGLGGFYLITN